MAEHSVAEIRATDVERHRLRAIRSLVHDPDAVVTVSVGEEAVRLPAPLLRVLLAAADVLEDGDTVVLVNEEAEVSPAQAAKLLGVSRQYVDRLIAANVLPSRRLPKSSYRKIPVRAVLAHRTTRDRKRGGIRSIVESMTDAGLDY
ncbi:MAG: helix-turn-helix domain-containing protein [Actinomycetota bacterium]|nr:helix-turn-helix domain-containing protein [Actinomycetota bacterium]